MENTLLVVTDHKFWLADRGDRTRIDHLFSHLYTLPLSTYVLYLGEFIPQDSNIVLNRYPNIQLFLTAQNLPQPFTHKHPRKFKLKAFAKEILKRLLPSVVITAFRTWHGRANPPNSSQHPEPHLSDFFRADYQSYFYQVFQQLQPQFVLVEYIRLAYLTQCLTPLERHATHLLIDTHDVMSERCKSFHQNGSPHWINISKTEEQQTLATFNTVMAIQPQDATRFKTMLPETAVITVGHASPIHPFPLPQHDKIVISYLASGGHANRQAILKFLEEVWPPLSQQFKKRLYLQIVGGVCQILDHDNCPPAVILLGYVDNLTEVYRDTDIIINPVFFGGGLKIKTVEALCYGKPLVTTSTGAEGLEPGINKAFLVCDTSKAMLQSLTALAHSLDLRQALSKQAVEFARQHFVPEVAYQSLHGVLL